jgi:hypothetical protein
MKQDIGFNQFVDAFRSYDRYDNFGYDGLKALFEHLEEVEEGGTEIELDVIALCCDYSQYDTAAEAAAELITGFEREKDETGEDFEDRALEELAENTEVIAYPGGVVVQSF